MSTRQVSIVYNGVAHVRQIPLGMTDDQAFAMIVKEKEVKPAVVEKQKPARPLSPAPGKLPPDATGQAYRIASTPSGVGWFHVIGPDGKPIQPKGIRKAEAEEQARKLNLEKRTSEEANAKAETQATTAQAASA